jgi:23S rRNA (uridine2552-2'-O)-methyltransferase
LSSQWLQKRRRDQFYKLAKARGYRSRASFKLLQANRSYQFINRGRNVVDLGAAPGGWLQIAREAVGESGLVLGVDKQEIEPFRERNIVTMIGDVESPLLVGAIREKMPGLVDVVLSDVSPSLTGSWDTDHARQIYLALQSLEIARKILRKGGSFFVKAFHGPDLQEFRSCLKLAFETVRIVKPPASRSDSSEIYFLGLNFIGKRDLGPLPEQHSEGSVQEDATNRSQSVAQEHREESPYSQA